MTTEQILEEILRLEKENPNNYALGEELRKLIWKIQKDNEVVNIKK
jgi:hypothetical protein